MDTAAQISNYSLLWLILILIPVMLINHKLEISLSKKIAVAVLRMIIQLSAVGFFLLVIFRINNIVINIIYLMFMMVIAAVTAINNSKLKIKRFFGIIFISFVLPTIAILLIFNKLIIGLENILDARYLVSIGGMILGNSIQGIITGVNDYYSNLKNNEKKYLYALSLSTSKYEALKPFITKALISAVNPVIASIEIVGLVALPGMMTGQILGGTIPLTAVKYQTAIMVAILGTRYLSTAMALFLTSVKAFDDYDLLIM